MSGDSKSIALEDHQRLLRAEEEERERECDLKLHAEQDARVEQEKREGAESQLQEAIQELEEREKRLGHGSRYVVGKRDGIRDALQLLRDKDTEPNGPGMVGMDQEWDKGTEQGGGDAVDPCRQNRATGKRHVAEAGVAVEGDPGLLDQALAALDEIASRPTTQRNPDGNDQAAEVMALLAREHAERIRELQGERGQG